jgi:threonine dehydrogenase-like Zn-dependent dehydrogenase
MRAAVMRQRALVVDDVPAPVPGHGEVLVRTLACGICGSDLHLLRHGDRFRENFAGATSFRMDPARDVVMGHEFCAEVVEHGPGTQRQLPAGRRVVSVPVTVRGGGTHSVGFSNDAPGGYGEYMVLSERLLLPVPDGIETARTALTEPLAVGWHAVARAHVEPGDVALVIGCGPIGLAVVNALRVADVHPIIAADFSARRRELAVAMGADVVLDPATTSPYASFAELSARARDGAPLPLDALTGARALRNGVFFECVGVPGVLDRMMAGARRGCRFVVVGVCMEPDRIRPALAITKELSLHFVLGYTAAEFAATLRGIADGSLRTEPLVTGRVGLDGVAGAFRELDNPEHHAKILVEPWR